MTMTEEDKGGFGKNKFMNANANEISRGWKKGSIACELADELCKHFTFRALIPPSLSSPKRSFEERRKLMREKTDGENCGNFPVITLSL